MITHTYSWNLQIRMRCKKPRGFIPSSAPDLDEKKIQTKLRSVVYLSAVCMCKTLKISQQQKKRERREPKKKDIASSYI